MKRCVPPAVVLFSLILSPVGCLYEPVEDTSVDVPDDTDALGDTATDATDATDASDAMDAMDATDASNLVTSNVTSN